MSTYLHQRQRCRERYGTDADARMLRGIQSKIRDGQVGPLSDNTCDVTWDGRLYRVAYDPRSKFPKTFLPPLGWQYTQQGRTP